MIQTVLGNIDSNKLGITMSHEHLSLDLKEVRKNDDSTFGYSKLLIDEINYAKSYGVNSFVEVTCNDMGRNVEDLVKLSNETKVNIIASTGFYLDMYHPQFVKDYKEEDIAELFIDEVTIGINDSNVKAGLIAEVASSENITQNEEKVLKAAGIAASYLGCAVSTHCQYGKLGDLQIKLLTLNNMSKEKIILGHVDLSNDIEYMRLLLDQGVNIAFDTIGKIDYLSDEIRTNNLIKLINLGYINQILLSQDISRKSYFSSFKKYDGYATVMKKFIPLLKKNNVSESDIEKMLIYNPQRILDIK